MTESVSLKSRDYYSPSPELTDGCAGNYIKKLRVDLLVYLEAPIDIYRNDQTSRSNFEIHP